MTTQKKSSSMGTRLNAFIQSPDMVAAIIFLVSLYLVLNLFLPTIREVNLWDESVYVNTGRSLAQGELPLFSRNPLIGVVYALTYLPFQNSDFWLVQSVSLGRVVLYTLMWWGTYLSFRQLREIVPPLVITGFLFVSPILAGIVVNPSDALFTAVSAFAFAQVLALYRTRELKHVWRGSLLVGLAALARNDGLVLMIVYFVLVILLLWKQPELKKGLLWAVVPFALVVGGYILLYGLVTGNFIMGLSGRSYVAFLQGQAHLYPNDPDCNLSSLKCGMLEVEKIYGTAKENNYSVFRAILGNPQAYLVKLRDSFTGLPGLILRAYGEMPLLILTLMGVRGAWELIKSKKGLLLAVIVLWAGYLGVYFVTFFRLGYLQMVFYLLYALAGVGVYALAGALDNPGEKTMWSAALCVGVLAGIVLHVETLTLVSLLILAILWIGWLGGRKLDGVAKTLPVMFLFLVLGALINRNFNPPAFKPYGSLPEEEALLLIREEIPEGSPVAAGAPGWVWAANMDYVDMQDDQFNSLTTSADLYDLLVKKDVSAIYVDHYLTNSSGPLWYLIEPEIGSYYDQVYMGRDGSIRILLVEKP